MKSKFKYYWFAALIPAIFIFWYFASAKENKPVRTLAYFGPKNALKVNDSTYHFIPEFSFTNQYREITTTATVKDKIYVAEYFFTTCKSICPIMNTNLERVYSTFKNKTDFLILSHTVDPEVDSVSTLLTYASKHGVHNRQWLFLTGKKNVLYSLARKGYLLNEEGDGGDEDFIHTQNFALVDKERHIRGFYDGTDSLEIDRLIQEINLLYKEYDFKAKINN